MSSYSANHTWAMYVSMRNENKLPEGLTLGEFGSHTEGKKCHFCVYVGKTGFSVSISVPEDEANVTDVEIHYKGQKLTNETKRVDDIYLPESLENVRDAVYKVLKDLLKESAESINLERIINGFRTLQIV